MKKRIPQLGTPGPAATAKRCRSGDLLRKAVQRNELTPDEVAVSLCLHRVAIDHLLDGSEVMSLPHQLCFATLLQERVPSLARSARALEAQVIAAIAFNERRTETHSQAPPGWRALRLI